MTTPNTEPLTTNSASRTRADRPVFGIGVSDPVVCFSEATLGGIRHMVGASGSIPHYEPYGIAFTTQTVFDCGGGPAL